MIKMSFYDGTLNRAKAKEIVTTTKKGFKYTSGLRYRNPTTCDVPITREKALELIEKESLLDIDEYEDYIHFNTYSANDMW